MLLMKFLRKIKKFLIPITTVDVTQQHIYESINGDSHCVLSAIRDILNEESECIFVYPKLYFMKGYRGWSGDFEKFSVMKIPKKVDEVLDLVDANKEMRPFSFKIKIPTEFLNKS